MGVKRAKNYIYQLARKKRNEIPYQMSDEEVYELLDCCLTATGRFQKYALFFVTQKQRNKAEDNLYVAQAELKGEGKIELTDDFQIYNQKDTE